MSKPKLDLTGQKIDRWEVLSFAGRRGKAAYWNCRCECGTERQVLHNTLKRGTSKSCGCLQKEVTSKRLTSHNLSRHPLYTIIRSVWERCYRDTHQNYERYGGRGIEICEEWRDVSKPEKFINWSLANGWEPGKNLQIDRIDNDGDYCPENCRWITHVENSRRRKTNKMNAELVKEIRANLPGKGSKSKYCREMAAKHNCGVATIRDIIYFKTWVDI